MPSKAWFETPLGQRYEIPHATQYPIVVGRASASGGGAEGPKLEIPQSEHTMTVSRRHAHLYRNETGGWEIEDAGSTAGLFLNGMKIDSGERFPLTSGTEIRFGTFEAIFKTDTPSAAPTPAPVEPSGDKTMVVGDFSPSEAPSWFARATGEKPQEAAPGIDQADRCFLDAWIKGVHQPIEISQLPGTTSWTIGRSPQGQPDAGAGEGHVQIPETDETRSVSRHHARLSRSPEGVWTLQNLSVQGSIVGTRHLKGEDLTALEPGEEVVFGTAVFVFRKGPLETPYQADDFRLESILARAPQQVIPEQMDSMPTRPLPHGVAAAIANKNSDVEKPWGQLIENKLVNPIQYTLTARRTRIGSHPLNSDIKLDGPGITDNYAVIQWGQKDVRIASKASNSPVRVNHAAYRTSPPLKTGDTITLGTREFRLDIVGDPPIATVSLVSQRIRRMAIIAMLVVICVFFGGLLAIRKLVPRPQSSQPPAPPDPKQLVQSVVRDYGLAGLSMLEHSEVGAGDLAREYEPVFDALHALDDAHRMIHKLPARTFDDNAAAIESKIETGKLVFELAGLSPSLAQGGWFSHDIADVFDKRRESAYGTQWKDFLKSLELTNIANARNQLNQMTHFPAAKLQAARDLVSLWEKCSEAARRKNEDDILREFRRACNSGASYDYIQDESKRLDALVADFERIDKDPGEPARALTRSDRWKEYHDHVRALRVTLTLLESYQAGDAAAFETTIAKINPGDQTALVATMKENLVEWIAWNQQFKTVKDPLSDFRLLSNLQQIQLKFQGTLDAKSPLARNIAERVQAFQGARTSQADALRREAAKLPDGFAKLDKLISAYEYDPSDEALQTLDKTATRLCGTMLHDGTADKHTQDMRNILKRYEDLAAKGVLTLDNIVSDRQMRKLLQGGN